MQFTRQLFELLPQISIYCSYLHSAQNRFVPRYKRVIETRSNDVLEKYKLLENECDVDILYRQSLGYPTSVRWTLFIVATWNDKLFAICPKAVREMVDFVDETFQSSVFSTPNLR